MIGGGLTRHCRGLYKAFKHLHSELYNFTALQALYDSFTWRGHMAVSHLFYTVVPDVAIWQLLFVRSYFR